MRKLNNEKADLIKEGSGDGTEFKELEKQYGDLMEERDSLEEELNNGKEEAAPGQKAAASTRVKRGAEEGPKEGAKAQKIEDGYTMSEAHKQINAKTLNKGITKAIKDWQVANAVEA